MPIETICEGCGERLRVADECVGRTARCPNCRSLYTVPKPQTEGAQAPRFAGDQPQSSEIADGVLPPAALLAGLPDDLFYVRWGGKSFGPVSRDELAVWHAGGRLPPDALVQREGFASITAAALFAPHTASAAADHVTGVAPMPLLRRHQGGLVLALGFASLGSLCSCFLVMPVLAIVALVVGTVELQKMHAGLSDPAGKLLVTLGMVLAALALLVFSGYVLLLFQ